MSFGIPELLLILVIVLLLFGTTKLKSLGSDLGSAIKGFRTAIDPDDKSKLEADSQEAISGDEEIKAEKAEKVESGKE
jgi:sec-independent protein translocase protein TatA